MKGTLQVKLRSSLLPSEHFRTVSSNKTREAKLQYVQILLKEECDPTLSEENGWEAVHVACLIGSNGNELLEELLRHDNRLANRVNAYVKFPMIVNLIKVK
jgi:hypothetical protein